MKKAIILLLIIVFVLFFVFRDDNSKNENSLYWEQEGYNNNFVCFNDNCLNVEVMKTNEERMKGLMFRENLDNDKGMLFVFDNSGNYSFWMKNTLIPLDIIWISEEGEIVDFNSAIPCYSEKCVSYGGDISAKYVLEVNNGFVEENKIVIGDKVFLNL